MDLLTKKDNEFIRRLHEKIIVFDGAMGTEIQKKNLTVDDFAGDEGLNEILVVTRPDIIKDIHASYYAAGSDVVETNSFGSSSIVLDEYNQGDRAFELSKQSAVIAKEVASSFSTKSHPRFVSGSVGPTTKLCSLGHIGFDDLRISYVTQIRGLLAGGVDLLQIETCQDPLQIKAAVQAAHEAFKAEGRRVPIIVQITVETVGTMLVGTETPAALVTIEALPVEGIGMNCATGPDLMKEHIRHLGQTSTRFISCLPNAGLPRNVGGHAVYDLTPSQLSAAMSEFVTEHRISMVGGCCGTTPAHINALAEAVKKLTPAARPTSFLPQVSSLYQAVPLDQDGTSPLFVGERTNANGSKLFKELLLKEDWSGITEMAKEQEREGSHVLDLCVAYVGRDEVRDMQESLKRIATQVTLPLMIDSTQLDVLEAALKMIGGRAIINSINLEDGEGKLDEICTLANRFGAALVALTIDEDGMAKPPNGNLRWHSGSTTSSLSATACREAACCSIR